MIQRNKLIDAVLESSYTASNFKALFKDLLSCKETISALLLRQINVSPLAHSQQSSYFEITIAHAIFGVRAHRDRVDTYLLKQIELFFLLF
jgi:hypothetical protein